MATPRVLVPLFLGILVFSVALNYDSMFQNPRAEVPLVFAGSGTCLPITRVLAAEFTRTHPGPMIEVPPSIGSQGGIRASMAGAISAGLISRELEENEKLQGFSVLPFARTAIAFGVHPSVSDDGITAEELIDIYSGTRTKWKDGQEIIVLTREPQDSAIQVLQLSIPGFREVYRQSYQAKRWTTLFTDAEMNNAISDTPGSMGVTDAGSIIVERLNIRTLGINGILPSTENVRSGKYPFFKTLSFIFHKEKLPDRGKAFIKFVRSEKGREILGDNGYLPVE